MWLKKLVAVSMIITLVGMNGIAIAGIFAPSKSGKELSATQQTSLTIPVITFSAQPQQVATGSFSSLTWSVEGTVDSCRGEGSWEGQKTAFGSQSTGRLAKEGNFTYALICKNAAGEAKQTVTVTVKTGAVSPPTTPTAPSSPGTPTVTYCNGASSCYGPREVAAHNSSGNCWGYNGNRVINISGFDAAFHRAKSGISSIEVGGVCGTNLANALGGSVGAEGQTRNHSNASKSNAERNMTSFFIGYYDAKKP